MSSEEFEILNMTDEEIEVRDVQTGHVFTYPVVVNSLEDRVLSGTGSVVPNELSGVRPEVLGKRVWNFAQAQMRAAEKIDSVFVQ